MATVLGIGAVVLGLAALTYARISARDAYDRLLTVGAVQLAESLYVQGGVVTLDPPVATFSALSQRDFVFYQITDPRGLIVAGAEDLPVDVDERALREGVVLADGIYQGRPIRLAVIGREVETGPSSGPSTGWARVAFAQTTTARDAMMRDLTGKALGIILVISALALGAILVSVGLVLAPLARIEAEIKGRSPDDLAPIAAEAPVEVATLVAAIDGFMARLAERVAMMQRFIADAAHQIRTPLAIVDAEIEMIETATTPEDARHRMEALRARIQDLSRLASQLLSHALVIHRRDASSFRPVELVGLARGVLAHAVPLSLDREVSVAFQADVPELWVDGDPLSLREALTNLLHNALTHGARSRLALHVTATDAFAGITVEDDGPGIAAAEQALLTEPFKAGAGSSGSGLGLAIVKDVVTSHHGRLTFGRGGFGFTAGFELPRRERPDLESA